MEDMGNYLLKIVDPEILLPVCQSIVETGKGTLVIT
jgi:hypothetical protein